MSNLVTPPTPLIPDVNGIPLDAGFVFFGVANQDPVNNPITVYWDAAKTQVATQPIRTRNGFFAKDGKPANIFVDADNCSVLIRNKLNTEVLKLLNMGLLTLSASVTTAVNVEKNRALLAESALQAQINANGVGNLAYKTYADMDAAKASIPANSKVTVTNDSTESNNGDWQWNGTVFTKSLFDPIAQAAADATVKVAAALNASNQYTDNKITPINNVLLESSEVIVDVRALATLSGYIDLGGNVASSSAYVRSDYIDVTQGQILEIFTQTHGAVATIATYNSSKVFIRYLSGPTEEFSSVTANIQSTEKFIRVSFYAEPSATEYANLITPAVYKEVPSKAVVDNLVDNNNYVNVEVGYFDFDKIGYYNVDGTNYIANEEWATFTPVLIKKGQTLTTHVYGQDGTAAFVFIKDGSGVSAIWGATGSSLSLQTFTYTATKDVYFWFNTQFTNAVKPQIKYTLFRDYIYLNESTIDHEVPSMQNFDDLKAIVNNYWKGKKIVWIGTSIPAFNVTDGKTYPGMIGQMLGCTMQNNALGESFITYNAANPNVVGAASYKTLSATVTEIKAFYGALYPSIPNDQLTAMAESASYEKLIIGTNADLVVFDHMHNDVDKSYVTYDVSEINSTNRTSFYGAFNYIIERLYADNPDVRIAFVSCPNRFLRDNPAYTIEKFDAFRTALRNLALKYNAPFIDLSILSNTNQFNYVLNTTGHDTGTGDVIHPSVFAKARYAAILAEHIRAIA